MKKIIKTAVGAIHESPIHKSPKIKIHTRTWVALGLILVLSPIILLTVLKPSPAEAEWFDESYAYRQSFSFTHDADIAAQRAITVTFDNAEMITAGAMQSDCDDVRFTDINGKVLLHDLTSTCNNASATYEAIFNSIINGSNVGYIYYGNPSAINAEIDSTVYTALTPSGGDPGAITDRTDEETGPGPIAWWTFDQGVDNTCPGGEDACDGSSSNADGTFGATTAAPSWQTEDLCVSGKCLLFDGSNDTMAVSTSVGDVQTVSFWIRLFSTTTTEQILDLNGGTDALTSTSGAVTATGFGTETIYVDGVSGATTLTANKWHHVSVTTASSLTASAITLGNISTNFGNFFIDELKFYPYARSAAQVKADFAARGSSQGVSARFGPDQKYLSDGLVGYWKMEEAGDATRADSSGNGTTLTESTSDTVGQVAGKFGYAGDFELGDTEYLSASDNTALSVTGSLTLSAWINPETISAGNYNILAKWGGSTDSYRLFQNGDEIRLELESDNNYQETTASNLAASTWYHVVGVYDARTATAKIYINGAEATSTTTGTIPSTITDDAGAFSIGAEDSGGTPTGYYDGIIDEARVYNRALSSKEVADLYSFAPGPVGHWKMDENKGQTSAPISVSEQVGASADDAEEPAAGGTTDTGSSDLELIHDTGVDQIVGLRFQTVAVPQGATISNAFIAFTANGGDSADADLVISGQDTDDAAVFTETSNNIGNRTTTTATVAWDNIPAWTTDENGPDTTTPDLSTIIQEIVDRPGWVSGNDIVFIITGSPGDVRDADSWDTNNGPGAATLDFDYTTDSATTYDSSTNGFNGTPTSTSETSWVPGKYGSALSLDGTADYIDIGTGPTKVNTIEFWVYPTTTSEHFIDLDGSNYISASSGTVSATGFSSPTIYVNGVVSTTIVANQWQHIAVTTETAENATDLDIGRLEGTDFLSGIIDDVRIYNYARTSGQIIEDMNAGHPLGGSPISSMVGYWALDELSGQTANDRGFGNNPATLGTSSSAEAADPTWQTPENCKINGCLYMDGDGHIEPGQGVNNDDLDIAGNLSFSFWFNADTVVNDAHMLHTGETGSETEADNDLYLIKWDTTSGNDLEYCHENSTGTDNCNIFDVNLSTSTWYHLAVTRDVSANTVKLFIDGHLRGTYDYTNDPTGGSGGETRFGSNDDGGNDFTGYMDEIKIYNATLTPAQILIDLNAGSAINFGTGTVEGATAYGGPGGDPPVGWWKFDENTGTSTTADSSGNGFTGTLTSITENSWIPGKYGSALQLDGAADFVDIGTGPSTVRTISFWTYPETTTEYFIDLNGSDYLSASSGTLDYTGDASETIYVNGVSSTTLTADTWQHITVVLSADDNASDLDIGRIETVGLLEGRIDEVKIYDYALNQAQISYDYNRGRPIAWYKLDECQGTTANDASGFGHTGSISIGGTGDYTSAGTCGSGTGTEAWNAGTTGKRNASLGFDGTNDFVDFFSSALNTKFNGDEGSISAWIKVSGSSVWTDGVARRAVSMRSGAADVLYMRRSTTDNQLQFVRFANSLTKAVVVSNITSTDWMHVAMTWSVSNDEFKAYMDGIQQGTTQTGLAAWTGTGLESPYTNIGTFDQTQLFWSGYADDVRVYNYALSATQVKKLLNDDAAVRFGPNEGSP
jgi:hypothetical protein